MALLDLPQSPCREIERFVPGRLPETLRRAQERVQEAVGMGALEIAPDAFRTEHALVEWKLFPRLEAHELVAAHLELDAALLTAEAAMRLYQSVGRVLALLGVAAGRLIVEMRP